ncbi:MAG: hypothetical protein PW790_11140 [Parvibaculaceae bacterium]|nr:hypothetical protein [Parvibaculaceae bacterium]
MMTNIIGPVIAKAVDEVNHDSGLPLPKKEGMRSMESYFEKMLFTNDASEQKASSLPLKDIFQSGGLTPSDEAKAPISPITLLETQMRAASLTVTLDYGAKIAAKTVQSISDLSKMQ